MAVSVVVAVAVGMLAFGGKSEAQAGDGAFLAREGTPPPGANVRCRPTRAHPYPVVLVHGTFETMEQNWAVVSPRLKREGYCVFALNYGNRGLGPIGDSAKELGRFVGNVMRFTGAQKVSLVGHSQGGMMPRRWIKSQNAGNRVDDLVGFAPSNYGTELNSATSEDSTAEDFGLPVSGTSGPCRACDQQSAGSPFLKRLNGGDDTLGSASYTQIATDDDEIIIPYTRCFLKGELRTANLTLQDYYEPDLIVTHQNIYDDPIAQEFMLDALDNPGPTKPGRALRDFPLPRAGA
ncbi:alpha/beta fold hydrolase [Rubrobacter tropicus]|uniref:Alpha/beta fold hydrolase n=1 Tax=Rubrobacter tropicus TaxID=2653851 RepID=A0A6G8Q9I0_9ACTN|nr:alpha/beta fold hydrolase [Rubrobacter tropicus]QIN83126.1 alpha/beta fold hydrolase [Rubrobacter tropicus]